MCFGSAPQAPVVPPAPAPPKRDEQAAAISDERKRAAKQPSTYGNVFTSALGDTGYGQNVQQLGV